MRTSVLVVHPDAALRTSLGDMLQRGGYRVRRMATFEEARVALAARPAALVAAIELGNYNGVHLVLDGRAMDPRLAAVVIGSRPDACIQADAQRLGAACLIAPIEEGPLLALVSQLIGGASPVDQAALYCDRRVSNRRAVVLEFSPERRQAERRRAMLARRAGG